MTDQRAPSKGGTVTAAVKPALHRYAPAVRQPWHRHDYGVVCLVMDGQVRESLARSREWVVQPFQVGIKPPGLRHAEEFGSEGAVAIRVVYEAAQLDALGRFAEPLLQWR